MIYVLHGKIKVHGHLRASLYIAFSAFCEHNIIVYTSRLEQAADT